MNDIIKFNNIEFLILLNSFLGYIQLSWDYNYKAASLDLFNDDRLLKNPDIGK